MKNPAVITTPTPETPGKQLAVDLRLIRPVSNQGAAARFRRTVVFCEVIADVLTVTSGVVLGYLTYDHLALGKHIYYPARTIFGLASALAIVVVLMLDRAGAYRRGNSLLRVRETEQVLRVSAEAFLVTLAVSFLTNNLFSRWLLVLCLILVPLALFVQKTSMYVLIRALHSRGYGIEKVLIYGSGHTGRRVFSALKRSPKLGLDPVAFVDDDSTKVGSVVHEMGYDRRRSAPIVRGPLNMELLKDHGIDLVIVAIPSIEPQKFTDIVEKTLAANAGVSFVPGHLLSTDPWIDYQDIDGVLLASFGRSSRWGGYDMLKRLCDCFGSLAMIVLGAPICLLLALVIWLDSEGPVLFRQERVGQGESVFGCTNFVPCRRRLHRMSIRHFPGMILESLELGGFCAEQVWMSCRSF